MKKRKVMISKISEHDFEEINPEELCSQLEEIENKIESIQTEELKTRVKFFGMLGVWID